MEIKWAELTTPNPCAFNQPFGWRFHIESFLPAPVPIDIGIVWVGSAKSSAHDIVLDEFEIQGIQPGANEFSIEHGAPDVLQIPRQELFDTITVMTISFSIGGQPFARIAYLVQVGAYGAESDSIRAGNSQAPVMGGTPESQRDAILKVLGRNIQAQRPRLTVLPVDDWYGYVAANDGVFKLKGTGQQQHQQPQDGNAEQATSSNNNDGAAAAAQVSHRQQAVSAD